MKEKKLVLKMHLDTTRAAVEENYRSWWWYGFITCGSKVDKTKCGRKKRTDCGYY